MKRNVLCTCLMILLSESVGTQNQPARSSASRIVRAVAASLADAVYQGRMDL